MVEIPRLPECRTWSGDLPAGGLGWFWWDTPEDDFGGQVMIRCPHGHIATLSAGKHQIAADGTVTPSIYFLGLCGDKEPFHEFGRLAGWMPADAARRG